MHNSGMPAHRPLPTPITLEGLLDLDSLSSPEDRFGIVTGEALTGVSAFR